MIVRPSDAPRDVQSVGSSSIVTASYAPDFERCKLLCETIDRHVTGFSRHYILVEHSDVPLFRQLESAKRIVIDERDLLPRWLRSFQDPTSLFRRRIWLSTRTMPLRGWHVQQLRRIGIAMHAQEDGLVYCDSDVVILKDFDCSVFWRDGDLRLFRRENAVPDDPDSEQNQWSRHAGQILGIEAPAFSPHDYIATLIAWRRDAIIGMCERIEQMSGHHWVEAIGSARKFSECMIYGRYADEVLEGRGHFSTQEELCRIYWRGPALSDENFRAFVDGMSPQQVAIGLQSFIGMDIGRVRRLVAEAN
ncbi:DUF6492 family protein [Aquibium sp. LZ166]|uniref:DUF6492 family protein n=1 Tax=Aquibium pacificus TaxID=3153579 RepID=A0ABV3SCP1_9HYPH